MDAILSFKAGKMLLKVICCAIPIASLGLINRPAPPAVGSRSRTPWMYRATAGVDARARQRRNAPPPPLRATLADPLQTTKEEDARTLPAEPTAGNDLIASIDEQHRIWTLESPFRAETFDRPRSADEGSEAMVAPDVERIAMLPSADGEGVERSNYVAVRTGGECPILDSSAADMIQTAAKKHRDLLSDDNAYDHISKYGGDAEVRVAELIVSNSDIKAVIDRALTEAVYPLVRTEFVEKNVATSHIVPDTPLCVHDALVTLYDAEMSQKSGKKGSAKDPLRRNEGLFTVVIELDARNNVSGTGDFEGGGTFFESLAGGDGPPVLHSLSRGHAIAFSSMERTAAAPTTAGKREVLLLFLTAQQGKESPRAPSMERVERLKAISQPLPRLDRMKTLRLALAENPDDGEAHLWFGFDLLYGDQEDRSDERWDDINRAVDHFETAARLSPQDARVFYQLGTARAMRWEYAEKTSRTNQLLSERQEREKAASALAENVRLESVAVEYGIHETSDIVTALLTLGDFYARLGRYDEMITQLDRHHKYTSIKLPFEIETLPDRDAPPKFEWINGVQKARSDGIPVDGTRGDDELAHVAIRTTGDDPILDSDTINMILSSAQQHWDSSSELTSRFTMQYDGNSEVHLEELCKSNPALKAAIDHALTTKIYPLVRAAFGEESAGIPASSLCVYESLVVRYDGDKAKMSGRIGASQPLHRDGGLISVNIALNSHSGQTTNGEVGFEGGGTFFENLIDNPFNSDQVLRPLAPGHAVAHRSTERHAGAPTTNGIRDILVLFLTVRQDPSLARAPDVVRGFLMKNMAQGAPLDMRLACFKLSMDHTPDDGEALFWHGFHSLSNGDNSDESEERWEAINRGVGNLKRAALLCPRDARFQFFLAMGLQTLLTYAERTSRTHWLDGSEEQILEWAAKAMKSALRSEEACADVRCNDGIDVPVALLTLGELYARLRRHREAIECLGKIRSSTHGIDEDRAQQMQQRARSIADYCEGELKSPSSQ